MGEGEDEDGRVESPSLAPGIKGHSLERSHEAGLGRSARHQY